MTQQAIDALRRADVVVGYNGYFTGLADLVAGKECIDLPLTQEVERAQVAVEWMGRGQTVCVISSGDAGVYGMASLVLECAGDAGMDDVTVVPGVSAINAAAALLGAPLGHDFAVISLSDLLTPWDTIERRLRAAAEADFVLAILNPKSQRRDWQLGRAQEILAAHRPPATPVGIVRNAFRPGQSIEQTSLGRMADATVDMFTTVIVGNTRTFQRGGAIVTPRGYRLRAQASAGRCHQGGGAPTDILQQSFRIIEQEVGTHGIAAREWPIVRRMIHAAGDVDLAQLVHFSPGAVAAGLQALKEKTSIVTDVHMVATGVQRSLREPLDIRVHCYLDAPGVALDAAEPDKTRCARAMERAVALHPQAIYVIGNAPTALRVLCAAVRDGAARPSLVIAMPVGFVGVLESKEEAFALPVPVIGVRGRRGGSGIAAAAVNALLQLAHEEAPP
jgi:precorrin-3B C17-methyltransferase